ncbi:unnamed protein product [Phytophthora fragariaefolia]|uniref:Unnamed protein product n=1 Tax=Phytophthora fragariaefolia TaxID=1490495 RepID=A0A9W6TYS4_9STRA|nr:unnamed protein product [Phytophthora fragariaefolia]
MSMAKNSRRHFADAAGLSDKKGLEQRKHVAFEDKYKLITPEKAARYVAPPRNVRVVALANWESAPTFVLDDHLFPDVSTDRLLNKCNPFLSGKRRALSEDIASDTLTVSTDCSLAPTEDQELYIIKRDSVTSDVPSSNDTAVYNVAVVPECKSDIFPVAPMVSTDCSVMEDHHAKDQKLHVVEEEESDVADEEELIASDEPSDEDVVEEVPECELSMVEISKRDDSSDAACTAAQKAFRWVCVGNGRYVKCGAELTTEVSSYEKQEDFSTVRWVQVGHGRYKKFYVNGDSWEDATTESEL